MRISDWSSDVCSSDLPAERGFDRARLPHLLVCRQRRGSEVRTPYIDGDEQEQPHHVDEMPVPGSRLEAEVLLWREIAIVEPLQADGEEDGAHHHVKAVEAGRHEEGDRKSTRLNSSH